MKEKFTDYNFSESNLLVLESITQVLSEYEHDGYDLSLRQLYYQLIARDLLPDTWIDTETGSKNSQNNYKRVGNLVNNARLAGLIDWEMIKDRNRETVKNTHWENPAEIVKAAAQQFKIDKWENQPCHVEVMVEKDALSGVLIPVCRELDIRFTANKGYSSSSMLYEVGKRIQKMIDLEKDVCIMYLGDHDPSGIDMTRDILERLEMFSWATIDVDRLALNMDQIEVLHPPENFAKTTDSRYKAYIKQFGASSWELDAIEPRQLASIVTEAVTSLRDEIIWKEAINLEKQMKRQLWNFVATYQDEQS